MRNNRVFGTDVTMLWIFVLLTVANCVPITRDGDFIALPNLMAETPEEDLDSTDRKRLTPSDYTEGQGNSSEFDTNAELNKEKMKQNTHTVLGVNQTVYKTINRSFVIHQPESVYYKMLKLRLKRSQHLYANTNNTDDEYADLTDSATESIEVFVEGTPNHTMAHKGRFQHESSDIVHHPKPISEAMHNAPGALDNSSHGVARKVRTGETEKRETSYDDGDPSTINVDLGRVHPNLEHINDATALSMETLYQKHGAVCMTIDGYGNRPIYVITRCPFPGLFREVRYLCENSESSARDSEDALVDTMNTPVQDASGFVYRNVYCAQCAGIAQPIAWTTKLVCDDIQTIEISDWKDKLSFVNQIGKPTLGCQRTLSPAYAARVHECSNVSSDRHHISPTHRTRVGGNGKDVSPLPLSFSVLMNFGFDGKTHILFSTENYLQTLCQQSQIYDPITDKCREISCNDGYTLIDGRCRKIVIEESDPTSRNLNFNEIKDTYQVTLTLRNVSYAVFALPGIEDMLKVTLVDMFEISKDRIGNLTVNVVNATKNKGSATPEIEVHRFVIPKPSTLNTHPNSPKGAVKEPHQAMASTESTAKVSEVYQNGMTTLPVDVYTGHDGFLNDFVADEMPEVNNNGNTKKYNHAEAHHSTTADKPTALDKTIYNATNTPKGHTADSGENPEDTELWHMFPGVSLKITFLLKPAFKANTLTQKSAKSVIQSMTELLNNKEFVLTVNGTNYQVESLNPAPTSMDKFCTKGDSRYYEDNQFEVLTLFDHEDQTNETRVVVKETGSQFGRGQYDLTVSVDGTLGNLSGAQFNSFVFVCVMPEIEDETCGRIMLNGDEFVTFDNLSIKFADVIYSSREYEYANEVNGSVRICAPDWSTLQLDYIQSKWAHACGDAMQKVVIAESYLSFILGVISLVAMMTVLVTYGLFERLRNLPGMNTINLTLSLFLAELVFITSGWLRPHQTWLCSGVGMLLHFLFLASFFWMNVMAYDVYRTFATKCILKQIRDKKKYLPRYALYAWGSPILIVGLCAFFDFSNLVKSVSIGYGGSVVSFDDVLSKKATSENGTGITTTRHVYSIGCWINEPVASMAAFGGPMILILLGNAAMFTRTIICIRSSTKMTTRRVRRSSQSHMIGHDDVMLYIRMSTVMGFTWVFGLASSTVSAFADSTSKAICIVLHVLAVLFIVFNCSQGMFMMFAFVFNRRVLALYKGLYHRLKNGRERPLSASSSRSTLSISGSHTLSQRL